MNKKHRYKILIDYLIDKGVVATQKELGAKMGYSNETTLSQIINGHMAEPKDFIEKLSQYLPTLNPQWLETGEGEMLTTAQTQTAGDNAQQQQAHGNGITQTMGGCSAEDANNLSKALDVISDMQGTIKEMSQKNQSNTERLLDMLDKYISK